jgi:glycine/D-amino acid oxidase-like deaminating enzyme
MWHELSAPSFAVYRAMRDENEFTECATLYAAPQPEHVAYARAKASADPTHARFVSAATLEPRAHEREALFTSPSGNANPAKAMRALEQAARAAGASFSYNCRVVGISQTASGFEINTATATAASERFRCRDLAICAGWHSAAIGALLGLSIPVLPVLGQMWAKRNTDAGVTSPGGGSTRSVLNNIQSTESYVFWGDSAAAAAAGMVLPMTTHARPDGPRLTHHLYGRETAGGEFVFGGDRVPLAATARDSALLGLRTAAPTAGAIIERGLRENMAQAHETLPFLAALPVTRRWHGVMPWSLDGLPLIGRIHVPQSHSASSSALPSDLSSSASSSRLFIGSGLMSAGFMRGPGAGFALAECMLAPSDAAFYAARPLLRAADPMRAGCVRALTEAERGELVLASTTREAQPSSKL